MTSAARAPALLALLCAGALVALGSFGHQSRSSLVVVATVLDHVFVFGLAAAALAGWGLGRLVGRSWLRVLVWSLAAAVAAGWAAAGVLDYLTFGRAPVVAQVTAPGRGYEVVVEESSADIPDPAWTVRIRQTDGLLARQWEVGCISGDSPEHAFRAAGWADTGSLVVTLARQTVTVPVEPETGEPSAVSGAPWGC